ncbi:bola protein [Chytridium lagenaria]|nr:bola protein [Chytridium lagenaria]
MGGIAKAELEKVLLEKIPAEHVAATDTSDGCGQSFEVIVVAKAFEGKTLLQRHRIVNEAAKTEIAQIHAFSQKSYTPQQWEDLNKA